MYATFIHPQLIEGLRFAASMAPAVDPLLHGQRGRVVQPITGKAEFGVIRADAAGDTPLFVRYRPSDVIGDNPTSGAVVRFNIRAHCGNSLPGSVESPDALASLVRTAPNEVLPSTVSQQAAATLAAVGDGVEQDGVILDFDGETGSIKTAAGRIYGFDWKALNAHAVSSADLTEGVRVSFVARGRMATQIAIAKQSKPGIFSSFVAAVTGA